MVRAPNRAMTHAIRQATSPANLLGEDPLRLGQISKRVASLLPPIPKGLIMHMVSLIIIVLIYTCMTLNEIMKIAYLKVNPMAQQVKKDFSKGKIKTI